MTKNVVTVVDKPSWFSAGDVSEDELLTMAIDDHTWDGVLAIYTDKVEWTLQDELDREHLHNLLEIRAYTEEEELHASRDALGSGFAWRLVNDVRAVAGAATYDARFDDVMVYDRVLSLLEIGALAQMTDRGNTDGVTDGIEYIQPSIVNIQHSMFDLQGRRIENPRKGLYIKNGKKILVK